MTPRVFLRGNPYNLGPAVPRQFLACLSGPDRKPFADGSGRLELARAIADPKNPLTARVFVNRVWQARRCTASASVAHTPCSPRRWSRHPAAVVCAWFNHRRNKMVVDDPRYSCFLSVQEEHVWIPGWLREFTDSDLASLICPRPLLVEQGKADGIGWWPMMLEEYEATKEHYRRLGLEDRIDIDLHEGGHEIRLEKSLSFLNKWLNP